MDECRAQAQLHKRPGRDAPRGALVAGGLRERQGIPDHREYLRRGRRRLQPLPRSQPAGRCQPEHRSEEHTSELQSLMRISYAVFCLKKKKNKQTNTKLSTTYHIKKLKLN